jgi:hypothetical protein
MGCAIACHIKERKHSQCQGNVDFHFSRRESPFPAKEVERDFTFLWVSKFPSFKCNQMG